MTNKYDNDSSDGNDIDDDDDYVKGNDDEDNAHLSLDEWQSSDGLVKSPDLRSGAGDQRGPCVHDGLTASFTQAQLRAHLQPGKTFMDKEEKGTMV